MRELAVWRPLLWIAAVLSVGAARPSLAQNSQIDRANALYARADQLSFRGSTDSLALGIKYLRLASELYRQGGDPVLEGMALNRAGSLFRQAGQPDSALVLYRGAYARAAGLGDRQGVPVVTLNLADTFQALGEADSALHYAHATEEAARAVANLRIQGSALAIIGAVLSRTGRSDSALVYLGRALSIAEAIPDRVGIERMSGSLGSVYRQLGRPDSAEYHLRRALALAEEIGDVHYQPELILGLGQLYRDAGDDDAAVSAFAEAFLLTTRYDDIPGQTAAVTALSGSLLRLGRPREALEFLDRALEIATSSSDQIGLSGVYARRAAAYQELGLPDSALQNLRWGLAASRRSTDQVAEAATLASLAAISRRTSGDLAHATALFDSAATLYAGIRRYSGSDDNRISVSEDIRARLLEWPLAWLSREDLTEEERARAALGAAERTRAAALLDLIEGSSEERVGADYVAEGARLVSSVTATGHVLLSYLPTRDSLLIWVGQPGGSLSVFRVPISLDSIGELVGESRLVLAQTEDLERCEVVGRIGSRTEVDSLLRELSRVLLPDPIRTMLASGREVVIVPQGILQLVPFAALPIDSAGTPLGARVALRYSPSLAVLEQANRREAADLRQSGAMINALIVSDPRMPRVACGSRTTVPYRLAEAGRFGQELAAGFGIRSLSGDSATEGAVRSALPTASLVHLGTHGYAYQTQTRARDSWVALAPGERDDGLLRVQEILEGGNLRAELVVLAACASGLGSSWQAEGTVGLQRAFLARGARSVLVSLWVVDQEAAVALLRVFYREWLESPDRPTKAVALQRAQEALRTDPDHPEWANPAYWAAFQLIGAP